jgi:hypothetical protein
VQLIEFMKNCWFWFFEKKKENQRTAGPSFHERTGNEMVVFIVAFFQSPTAKKHLSQHRLFKLNCYLNLPDVVVQPSIAETTKILARMVIFCHLPQILIP